MMISLTTKGPCGVCGYVRSGLMVSTVRVNKRSMRTYGTNLIFLPGACRECGRVTDWPDTVYWRPYPEDAEKIQAYRLRKWPELATEPTQRAG